MADPPTPPGSIHTDGGTFVDGPVSTSGGAFIGRDQTTININIAQLTLAAQHYVRDALHQLPGLPEHFVGRAEELAAITAISSGVADNAVVNNAVVSISSLQGMGGIGKTALATVAAYALRERYPDAQLFLALATHSLAPRSAERARDDVLHAFYPTAKLPDDEATLWNLYRSALSQTRAILILDDVRDDAQIAPLLPPPGCAAILTSRQSLSSGQPIALPVLPRAESIALIRRFRPNLLRPIRLR